MSGQGELEIVILGCGSSGGVPRGDGDWGDCDPSEPRNRRTRCSMLARRHGPDGVTSVVIDTSPDFRQQMLAAEVRHVDAVLYTHDHADQTHGIDDLRVFAAHARRRIPAWMDAATHHALTRRFDYIFESHHGYPAIVEAHHLPPHGQSWEVEGAGGPIPVMTLRPGRRGSGSRERRSAVDHRRAALHAASNPCSRRSSLGVDRARRGFQSRAD